MKGSHGAPVVGHAFVSEQLIEQIRKRHGNTTTELVQRYGPILHRFCLGHGISENDAEDLLQSTWDAFFNAFNNFQNRSQLQTYLVGILHNKIREHWRQVKRYQLNEDMTPLIDGQPERWSRLFASLQGPEQQTSHKETLEILEEALEILTPEQRRVFVMKHFEEASSSEICRSLDLSSNNLRVILHRAKLRLKTFLTKTEMSSALV